ncbi:hypothetical protein [Actinomycetospora soli]|uniref:hypothetical protein n=1 Tax=Actinomycetospora soli TaxID=2893887 RepID=UPI001E291422|nr:hypothetical protein [Actinomycetospora soli]MCD2188403.1 hypothetical protein [Actinomycetospora soli]
MREQLDAIIGTWRTEGEVDDGTTVRGTDAYSWLGDAFVVHHVDVVMGDSPVRALEVIGPVSASPVPTRAFGGDGSVEESTLELTPDGHLSFGGPGARSVMRVDGDTGTGVWHRDGVAEPWMTLRFTRA